MASTKHSSEYGNVYEEMEGPEKRPSSKHGQSNRSTISSRKCVCAVVIAVIITLVLTTVIVVLVMMMAITDEDDCHESGDRDESNGPEIPSQSPNTTQTVPEQEVTLPAMVVTGGFYWENGRRYSRNTVDIFRLSPVGRITKSHTGTPSPVKWTKAGRTVRRGQLYISGGQTWDGGFNYDGLSNVGRYNIKDNMWEILPNSSFRGGYPEHYGRTWGPALFTMNNKLYEVGGDDGFDTATPLEAMDLDNIAQGWTKQTTSLPGGNTLGGNNVVTVGSKVYVTIGPKSQATNKVYSWDGNEGNSLKPIANMHYTRNMLGLCMATDGIDNIWVIGGCVPSTGCDLMEQYKISTNEWLYERVPDQPHLSFWVQEGRRWKPALHGILARPIVQLCGFSQGFIYAVFSDSWQSGLDKRFHVYDTRRKTWSISDTELDEEVYFPVSAVIESSSD